MSSVLLFFFFNDTATTEIYTLSLHDALPICTGCRRRPVVERDSQWYPLCYGAVHRGEPLHVRRGHRQDRKSTRLNSSHANISYAVFCLKKKKKTKTHSNTFLKLKSNTQPTH